MRRARRLAGLCVVVLLLLGARPTAGHGLQPIIMRLSERSPQRFTVEVQAPPGSARPELRRPAACRELREPGPLLDCSPLGLRGATLRLTEAGPAPASEPQEVFLVVRFLDGTIESAVLRGPSDALVLAPLPGGVKGADGPSGPAHATRVTLGRYGWLGVRHVLSGADHVLFVLALLLLLPRPRALVLALTAFTLAHSAALALSTLGWLRPEPRWVEALIALSVLLLARELLRPPAHAPWTVRHPSALTFACGLLHGLGFAGALAEVGLPRGQALLALGAFNGGVELGQLALVLGALAPLRWIGRRRALRPGAYAIGACAAAWTIERVGLLLAL
ncbi:MAG: HupE/UreJ family protein [Polyangia bacterium]